MISKRLFEDNHFLKDDAIECFKCALAITPTLDALKISLNQHVLISKNDLQRVVIFIIGQVNMDEGQIALWVENLLSMLIMIQGT